MAKGKDKKKEKTQEIPYNVEGLNDHADDLEVVKKPTRKPKAKTEGVVLMAFGKLGYFYAAYNMAQSIKRFNPNIKISLIHDGSFIHHLSHLGYFDKAFKLKDEDLMTDGTMSPARAKISLYKYLPYDYNLYLDVDGIVLKDIQPLIDHCKGLGKPYATEVRGVGGYGDTINYAIWANHEDIWKHFGLDKGESKYPAIQSSFAYIEKCAEAKKIFDTARKFYVKGFPLDKITMPWGNTIPDELIFSGTCAKLGYNPTANKYPIFFGWKHTNLSYTEITDKYFVLSLYGNGKGTTLTKRHYIEWYDRLMRGISRAMGVPYHYKAVYIMRDKHANQRK